jgi:hypothetical protein
MSDVDFEQVKKLVEQLAPEWRRQLLDHLAALPDSGITNLNNPPASFDGATQESGTTVDGDYYDLLFNPTSAAILLKGRVIFQVFFNPENYRLSRMEVHAGKDVPPTEQMKEQIREIFTLHNSPEPEEESLIEAIKQSQMQVDEAKTFRMSNEISARLPHMAILLFDGGVKIIELAVENSLAEYFGTRKKTVEEILERLEPHWKQIKAHLNLSPGGRQNVKHEWSLRDHTCLAVHYNRLKPVWRDAKKTARSALKSNNASRRRNWKEQVIAAYKDEELPMDLIEQLAPSVNSQPADLALTHAARLCLPVSYSTKVLKEKLRKFNPAPKPSSKSDKSAGVS